MSPPPPIGVAGVEVWNFFHQLELSPALARDDPEVVVGRDEDAARLRRQVPGARLAILGLPVVVDHLGAIALGRRHLQGGRVRRHQEDGRGSRELGGEGHALGMVARGEADHAALALLVAEGQELVERAANLEGAGTLEILALEEDVVAAPLVERAARDDRRMVNARA
jgi:hypothetical protein